MKNPLVLLAIFLVVALGFILHSLGTILVPFFSGFIGAYILNKPVTAISKKFMPRGLAALLMILAVLFLLGLLMMGAVPFLHKEFTLLSHNMPALVQHFYSIINPILDFVSERLSPQDIAKFKTQLSGQFGSIITWMVQFIIDILSDGLALANVVSLLFLTPVIMFYILKDWPNVIQSIEALLPKKYRTKIVQYALTVDQNLSSYAKGQMTVCLILALLYSAGLVAVGLNNAVFVGIFTGCISFIPYVGALIGFLLSTLIHLSAGGSWNPLISIGLVFLIVQSIEGNFLTPRFVGGRIGVHPVWILFALLAGATWFGFMGIVLALPTAAIISTVVRAVWKELE
jgi:predicted PurR-regulated permease PerM